VSQDLPLADVRALLERISHSPPRGPLYEELPSVATAQQWFRERPGLAHVMTESGMLSRDGTLTFPRWSR
jgi:hypothetical protein